MMEISSGVRVRENTSYFVEEGSDHGIGVVTGYWRV